MLEEIVVHVYQTETGKIPFNEWQDSLKDAKAIDIIRARVARLRVGNHGDTKWVGAGVRELRIHYGPGLRIYFSQKGQAHILLLCGGDKKARVLTSKRRINIGRIIGGETMKPSKNYKEGLLKDLLDPQRALGYLKAALEDEDRRVFLLALKDVAEAQGGITRLARLANLSREHLYDMLSKKGNPEFLGLDTLLAALGFRLSVEAAESSKFKKAA